jgi:hypothetical protein
LPEDILISGLKNAVNQVINSVKVIKAWL